MSAAGRRRGASAARNSVPMLGLLAAFVVAAVLLPTALRPPPDPSNQSGAINPNAPPDNNVQLIEGSQQASGGAGSGEGATTTTTIPPKAQASLSYCYGNPPRQIPSVYSGPCVGVWQGNNGGSTSKNVFPNEIRIGFEGASSPPEGRLPDVSSNNSSTSGGTRTWQALQEYFNQHFQLYNRKIVFYGTGEPTQDTEADYQAMVSKMADEYQTFIMNSTIVGVCRPFVRRGLNAMCDPFSRADGEAYRPGLYSQMMDLDQGMEFGSEFACKSLVGRATKFGGDDVNGKPRKFGYLGYLGGKGGIQGEKFAAAFKRECGADVEVATMNSQNDAQGAAAAITRFRADGVTSVIFYNQGVNVLVAMQQADNLSYNPEWVMVGAFAVDTNLIGLALPPKQAAHLFGLSGSQEWPQKNASRECWQAVRTIDPTLNADSGLCTQWWIQLVLQLSGFQGAGPKLTPESFQRGMVGLGHRFDMAPWAKGGGYGPGDWAYSDDVGLVWWSATAQNPTNGTLGAYVWTHGGKRFQRGQLPEGDAEFFQSGESVAPD